MQTKKKQAVYEHWKWQLHKLSGNLQNVAVKKIQMLDMKYVKSNKSNSITYLKVQKRTIIISIRKARKL